MLKPFEISFLIAKPKSIAVLDFEGKDISDSEASILTDRLRSELFNLGNYKVLERALMEDILREQGLQQSGICNSSECAVEIGNLLGTRGKEFGTVTSRKRRCGWFDGVLVRQTIKISGIDGIALTKLDVLDELDEIKMCIQYELNGKKIDYLPAAVEDQLKIKPIYKSFPGWKTSTNGIKNIKDLPENAKKYIYAVEDFVEAKISSISTSPERDDTILIENPFEI